MLLHPEPRTERCRPVWVNSRSICRFPVVVRQGAVVGHLAVNSTGPVGREATDPVWGIWLACVPSVSS